MGIEIWIPIALGVVGLVLTVYFGRRKSHRQEQSQNMQGVEQRQIQECGGNQCQNQSVNK